MDKTFKFTLPSPNFSRKVQDTCKPKPHYLTPSGMSLLPREKQPPPMYGKHGATLPARFLKPNIAQEERNSLAIYPPEKQYCEPCEIDFNSLEDLKRHRAQHEQCPVAGCLYKGHPTVMDKHINALHASGLFDKFKKLSTPEEIAAWREERRKRYPTLANVILKQKAKEQRQKRGERLENNKNRFGNVNDKKRAHPNVTDNKCPIDEKKPREENGSKVTKNNKKRKNKNRSKNVEIKPKVQVNENRMDGVLEEADLSCGGVNMFKGTMQLKNYKHFSDKNLTAKNALFGLVGMYGSDDEQSSDDEMVQSDITNVGKIEASVNSKLMEDCLKTQDNVEKFQESHNTDCNLKYQKLETDKESCKLINDHIQGHEVGSLLLGCIENASNDACNEEHKSSDDEAPEETPIQRSNPDFPLKQEPKVTSLNDLESKCRPPKQEKKVASKPVKKFGLDYRKARLRKQNTMLEKLLESDIRHERNVLLQCVRFVTENNFFDIGQNK